MKYRELGESALQVSALTFGAWAIGGWMWGGADRKEAVEAIKASLDEGVTSIDTAPVYGMGVSEEIVAEALQGVARDKVQILTKFGMRWDVKQGDFAFHTQNNDGQEIDVYKYAGKDSVIQECENSLRRLKTDYIDLYQIHWPDSTTPISETMEALDILQKQGKIRAAGVCNYSTAQFMEAEETLSLASNQVPYSMVERSIEKELVPYAMARQKAIIAYSPLQRGILTGKIKPGHQFGEGDTRSGSRFYQPENLTKINAFLDEIRPMAQEKGATLSQLVIRWTIEQPGITVALVGARNAEQAIQNAQSIHISLSPEEIGVINKHLSNLSLI
ncbi:aldo/keto reductase [Siphonobacter sp. SORGH_AS_0500]|uniref:aldo/keto reductase n=1 Tax=Siphonobacter sp. SORGH_AS_0500 TaxID=1864824 RepID=UPI000CC1C558|nr:aldo/keto reductase [Siphonobacter sp. SORGH_AS_0500]PKK38041.1 aldo/keto reductase [Siphonobacter sp. SORGH_AS_0500]